MSALGLGRSHSKTHPRLTLQQLLGLEASRLAVNLACESNVAAIELILIVAASKRVAACLIAVGNVCFSYYKLAAHARAYVSGAGAPARTSHVNGAQQ